MENTESEDLTNIVFINEIQGYVDDYVELYNAGENEVNISNFVLDDNYNNDTKVFGDKYFTLPQGSIIQPKGFLVFYKGNKQQVAAGTHFKFGIKGEGGETITLVNGTTIIDQLVGPDKNLDDEPFNEGRSYGRYPDGSDNLMLMTPTPGVSNKLPIELINSIAVEYCNKNNYKVFTYAADSSLIWIRESAGENYYLLNPSDSNYNTSFFKNSKIEVFGSNIYGQGLLEDSIVNVINNNGNKYLFNGKTTYNEDLRYFLRKYTYVLKNIPENHPMAIISNNNIEYTGDSSKKLTKSVDGVSYDFYYGDITLTVNDDFGTASVYCYYHGYIGGNNIFIYDEEVANDICFTAGSLIKTDQGLIKVEKLIPGFNTIDNKKILAIPTTRPNNLKNIICFEKDALGPNIPSQDSYFTHTHKIDYKGHLIEAMKFLMGEINNKIYIVEYNNELLYNVLLENYSKMSVNNILVETLHPDNIISKKYLESIV